jgi:hypothetical protein
MCAACIRAGADIALIVDRSGGGLDNWTTQVIEFVHHLIDGRPYWGSYTHQLRLGVVSFNATAWLSFGIERYQNVNLIHPAVRFRDVIITTNGWKTHGK